MAKIILKDEVNCKIEGLDLDTRKKLVNKFSFMLPYAYHVPAYKLGRWDGKVNYFNIGGSTYINLLEDILPVLLDEGYEVDVEDRRQSIKLEFPQITEQHFSHKTWPEKHPAAGEPVVLRDYQGEIINEILANPPCLQENAT